MASVKLIQIQNPPHYLREKIKAGYVNDLLTDLALINGVKDWRELVQAKGKKVKLEWPFPPIEIARNEKQILPPAEKGSKPSDTKKKLKVSKKKYFPFELIDGSHRITVARRLKMKEIPATIKQVTDPAERFLAQYKANGGPRGLRLDKDDRDNAIRILSNEFKFSQKKLVEETGLDQTSISRIISSKQRREGPRQAPKKKNQADGSGSAFSETQSKPTAQAEATMSVNGFVERLQICCSELPRLKSKIIVYLDGVSNEKSLSLLIARTEEILVILADTYKKKFPAKEPAQATGA